MPTASIPATPQLTLQAVESFIRKPPDVWEDQLRLAARYQRYLLKNPAFQPITISATMTPDENRRFNAWCLARVQLAHPEAWGKLSRIIEQRRLVLHGEAIKAAATAKLQAARDKAKNYKREYRKGLRRRSTATP